MPVRPPSPASRRRIGALAIGVALAVTATLAGCSDDSGSQEAFCAQVRKVPALETVLARFSEADPDVLADRVDQARTAYHQLADDAPSEIHDQTEQVVSLVDAVLDAVEQNPNDPAKASAQLRKAMSSHKGVAADREKVTAYAQDQCGVQLDATLSNDATTTTTSTGSTGGSSTTTPSGPTTTGG